MERVVVMVIGEFKWGSANLQGWRCECEREFVFGIGRDLQCLWILLVRGVAVTLMETHTLGCFSISLHSSTQLAVSHEVQHSNFRWDILS